MPGEGCIRCCKPISESYPIFERMFYDCASCQRPYGNTILECSGTGKKKHRFIVCGVCHALLTKPRDQVRNWWRPWSHDTT